MPLYTGLTGLEFLASLGLTGLTGLTGLGAGGLGAPSVSIWRRVVARVEALHVGLEKESPDLGLAPDEAALGQ